MPYEYSNGSVNSKRAHPPSGICQAFVILSVPVLEICQKTWGEKRPGVGHLSILLEAVNVVPFSIFHKKNMPFRYINMNNIFNTCALKRYVQFSLHHFPTPQYFLHPSKKLLPAILISSFTEEKQSMSRLKS